MSSEGAGSRHTVESSDPERRVWAALPPGTRQVLEEELSGSDLQTLLLALTRRRSDAVSPASLMRRWREDRFVRPASVAPRRLARSLATERLTELVDATP